MMRAMLLKNPISTRQDFAAGGSRVPILTRNPAQSTAGYQNFGLPTGKSSGGSANITHLGAIRMGDQDGNAPGSAIYPDDIFYPPGQADRKYTQVSFENVGNNVYQPDSVQQAAATEVLLRRLGDQQFKATERAPFEDYFVTQKLAKEVDEASRSAGLEDLGHSREIMRSIVAERRKGNEEDFLRRMLDAGMTQQDAQKEVDDVRRAMALQEARKVEDRTHQAKLLIQRIAKSRGVLSSVNEPLTTSGAIENPQMNERMADMTNQPQNAYGSSPLDRDRIFKTPDYYKRVLRRTGLTQEAGDEMSALANATAQAEGFVPTPSMLQGIEREDAIERKRDSVATRLENATTGRKLMGKMPKILDVFSSVLTGLKKAGSSNYFRKYQVDELTPFQCVLALNQVINEEGTKAVELKQLLRPMDLFQKGTDRPSDFISQKLSKITRDVLGETIQLPVVTSKGLTKEQIFIVLSGLKSLNENEIRAIRTEVAGYSPIDDYFGGTPAQGELPPSPLDTRSPYKQRVDQTAEKTRSLRDFIRAQLTGGFRDLEEGLKPLIRAPAVQVEVGAGRGAPALGGAGGGAAGGGGARRYTPEELGSMNLETLKGIARERGLATSGKKAVLVGRISSAR